MKKDFLHFESRSSSAHLGNSFWQWQLRWGERLVGPLGLTSTGCHCHGRKPAPFLARGWHLGATLPSWQVAVRMSFPRFEAGLAEVPAPTMCSRRAAHCGRRVFSTRRFLLRPQGLALSARAFISKPRCSQIDLRRPRTDAATGEPSGRAVWRRAARSVPTTPLHSR